MHFQYVFICKLGDINFKAYFYITLSNKTFSGLLNIGNMFVYLVVSDI